MTASLFHAFQLPLRYRSAYDDGRASSNAPSNASSNLYKGRQYSELPASACVLLGNTEIIQGSMDKKLPIERNKSMIAEWGENISTKIIKEGTLPTKKS